MLLDINYTQDGGNINSDKWTENKKLVSHGQQE